MECKGVEYKKEWCKNLERLSLEKQRLIQVAATTFQNELNAGKAKLKTSCKFQLLVDNLSRFLYRKLKKKKKFINNTLKCDRFRFGTEVARRLKRVLIKLRNSV